MVDGRTFIRAAVIRAIHTMLQTMIAMIPAAAGVRAINLLGVFGTGVLAGVVSLLKSTLIGMPEVVPEEDEDEGEGDWER